MKWINWWTLLYFSVSSNLTQMVNFSPWISDWDFHSPALLDFFFSTDPSICFGMGFPPMENSDHAVVSVSIDFASNSKRDTSLHSIAISILLLIGMVLWSFEKCSMEGYLWTWCFFFYLIFTSCKAKQPLRGWSYKKKKYKKIKAYRKSV